MADLIDRQALLEWFKNWSDYDEFSVGYITGVIEDEPSADIDLSDFSDRLWRAAYERGKAGVVRCKDCKHHIFDGDRWLCKLLSNNYEPVVEMDDDGYCSYGERKDGEQDG